MRFYLKFLILAVILTALTSAGYCAAVSVTESTLTIPTYSYEKGLFTPLPVDRLPGYPYPNLRQQDVDKTPTPREYRAVVLENDYVKITLLPDLGCRLYKMIYKPTNQSVFYENEPLKPNPFCEQGWWMATGGVEWCFPLTEHSTNVLRPWNYVIKKNADGSATVAFSDDHQRTGLSGAFEMTLAPDSCAFNVNFRLTNPGYSDKRFMYWSNAQFPAHDGVEFVVPTKWMSYEWNTFPWPVSDGKDLSKFDNWPTYDSKFAAKLYAGFDGIYDHTRNLGLVRTFPLGVAKGAKIFSYGHTDAVYLQPPRYTDTGKGYFELMGGYTRSFWNEENIAPRQVIEWQEDWYPIAETGGFNAACADVAVKSEVKQVNKSSKSVKMVLFPSRNISNASVTLYVGNSLVKKWNMDLQCGKAVTLESSFSEFGYANARIYAGRKSLLKFNLEEPAVKEKQPQPIPGMDRPDPATAADYINADQPAEAIKVFEKTYTGGPREATAYATALIRTGKANDAMFWLQKCQRADSVPGYLIARILLQKGDYKAAKAALQAAVNANKKDMRALDALAVVENRLGNTEQAKALFTKVLSELPADLLANSEMATLGDTNCSSRLQQFLANGAQNSVYLALDYYYLGDYKIARQYAENAATQEPGNVVAGVVQLVCAYHLNDNAGVESAAKAIANIDVENGLVYGSDDVVMVLEEANRIVPDSSRLMLYLATAYQIRNNRMPARDMAEAAAKAEPTLARAYFIQAQCQTAGVKTDYEYTTAVNQVAKLLDKCLALNPTSPGYYYTAGWLYPRSERRHASTQAMKKAVELDPYCYSAYYAMARDAIEERKDFAEAVKWFRKEADSPQHLNGEGHLVEAYGEWMRYLLKEKNYEKLAQVYKEADSLPKTGIRNDFLLTKANALLALKRDEDARKVLQDMTAKKDELLKDGWAYDWYYLGCALDMLGEKDEAKTLWTKGKDQIEPNVKKYPQWEYGAYVLAIIQNKLGQQKEAYENIIKLKKMFKTNSDYSAAYEEIQAAVEKK